MTQADGLAGETFNSPTQQPPINPEHLGQAAAAGFVDQLAEPGTAGLGEGSGGETAHSLIQRDAVLGPEMEQYLPIHPSGTSLDRAPITPDKPEDKPNQPSIPAHIREVAARAVESFLADGPVNNRHEVTIGKLARLAFDGQKVPKKEFRMFESAIRQDSRLEYQPAKRRFATQGFNDSASAEPVTEKSRPPRRRGRKKPAPPQNRKRLDDMLVELRHDPDISESVASAKSQHHRKSRHQRSRAKSFAKQANSNPAKKRL
ncbi:MAG TPA: hypothetical protein VNG32_02890 [Candidatus Dormibacteraeota bacterium]|nr:hypothetical protein [Candidatus Dormibacteraeota bacterium]